MFSTQSPQEVEHKRQSFASKRILAEEIIGCKASIGKMILDAIRYIIRQRDDDSMDAANNILEDTLERVRALDYNTDEYRLLLAELLFFKHYFVNYFEGKSLTSSEHLQQSIAQLDQVQEELMPLFAPLAYLEMYSEQNKREHIERAYRISLRVHYACMDLKLFDPIVVRYTNFLLQEGRLFDAVSAFYHKRDSSPPTYHAIVFYAAMRTLERTIETQQEFGGEHADTIEKLITLNKDLGPLALLLKGIKHHTMSYLPINERNQEAVDKARTYYKRCMTECSTDWESWFLVSAYAAQRLAKLYDENDLYIRDDYYEIILTLGIFLALIKRQHLTLTLYRNIVPEEDFEINKPLFDVDTYFQALRYYSEFEPVSTQWWRLRVDEMQILLAMTTVNSSDKLNLLDQVVIFMQLAEQEEKAMLLQGEADELRSEDDYYYSSDE